MEGWRGGGSSVARAPVPSRKGLGFESRQEWREIFFSVQGQLSVLTFYFGILYEVESEAGVPKTRAIRDCVVCSEAL